MSTQTKNIKLFGNTKKRARSKRRKKSPFRIIGVLVVLAAVFEILYFTVVYSNIPFIAKYRTLYIETAMSTMNHQWLATAFIPQSVIDEVLAARYETEDQQSEIVSTWQTPEPEASAALLSSEEAAEESEKPASSVEESDPEQLEFYDLFWEIDPLTMKYYVSENPDVLENGWMNIKINEAGLDKNGTSIYTIQGEQVLAIDAANNILIVRLSGDGYRGVLAIVKDPSQLSVANASSIGSYGQFASVIAEKNGALLAMNASGFDDPEGVGNGGTVGGLSIASGVRAGSKALSSYKRMEIRSDNRMYIVNSYNDVDSDTRDAVEFLPALIVDGVQLVEGSAGWGTQPRTVFGQSDKLEILMMVVEGRQSFSIGITIGECADILMKHNAMQALNLDGGSSAIMVYEGEPLTICSNGTTTGRTLPNAFIVVPATH